MNNDFDAEFVAAGRENDIDPRLIKTAFHLESGGNPSTMDSPQGAQGGMQMLPATAASVGVSDPRDIHSAIRGAARYLAQGLGATGTPQGALAYYHGGPDRAQWGPKTAAYVAKGEGLYPSMTITAQAAQPAADEDVAAGQAAFQALTGKGSASAAPSADQDVAAGQAAFRALTAGAPVAQAPAGVGSIVDNVHARLANGGVDIRHPLLQQRLATGGQDSALGRVADAVYGGIGSAFGTAPVISTAPLGMAPDQTAALRQSGIIEPAPGQGTLLQRANEAGVNALAPVVDAAGRVIGLVARGANALYSGAQAGVAQAGAEAGAPQLGRDLAAMPDAFAGSPGTLGRVSENRLTAPAAPADANRLRVAPPTSPVEAPRAQLMVEAPAPIPAGTAIIRPGETVAPSATGPSSPIAAADGAPQFQSMGAAASREGSAPENLIANSPVDSAQNLRTSVTQSAADRAGPNGAEDQNVYVPGVERPLAARVFTPENAVAEKTLRETDPAYDARYKALEKNNNDTMLELYKGHAGDPRSLDLLEENRDALSPDALNLFSRQAPVANPEAPVALIDQILASPAGKRDAVVSALRNARAKLLDANGNPERMPDVLYGARQNITDMLRARGTKEASDAMLAKSQLIQVKDALDAQIATGAPEYTKYLSDYAAASRPIEQQQFLQSYLTGNGKITDVNGNLQFIKVQKLLEKIDSDRQKPGVNPAKSLGDDQINDLIAIRNELAAFARRDALSNTRGSDTTQKIHAAGALGAAAGGVGRLAIHGALAATTHGVGNMLYEQAVRPALKARAAKKGVEQTTELKNRLLDTAPTLDH